MTTIVSSNVAYCGLYCGACSAFKKGRCKGCRLNEKATWCKIRTCCAENHYVTCADCTRFTNPMECRKFNNFMSKLFAFVFKSDRAACIAQIKECGVEKYAEAMNALGSPSVKKG